MAVLRYSLIRLGLFALAFGGLVLAGLNLWMAPVVAAFVAWGLSYVLLARFRDAAASELAQRAERRAARGDRVELHGHAREDADAEDAAAEADEPGAEAGPEDSPPQSDSPSPSSSAKTSSS